MAYAFKNLDFSVQTAKSDVFTVPAGKQVVAIGLRVSNKSNDNQKITVYRYRAASVSEDVISGSETVIPVGSALNLTDGNRLVFNAGDILRAEGFTADTMSLSFDYLELDVAA